MVTEAEGITPEDDIRVACETYGTGANQPEQLLYDCYVCTCVLCPHPSGAGEYFVSYHISLIAGTRLKQCYGQKKTESEFITQDS